MKEMTIYIFLLLFGYCVTVNFTCSKDRPFVWKDNECGSFTEICIKSGVDECDFGRRACEQCPLASLSPTTIDEMLTIMYTAKAKGFLWIILIIVLFLLIFSILILLQITQCFSRLQQKNGKRKKQEGVINRKLEKLSDTIGIRICVKLPEFHKSMKLIVHQNDNIVTIKQKIFAQLVNTKKIDDFKMMQLQYNGEVLDDNQCFPKIVSLESNAFHCIMNEELKTSTTILKFQGNIYVPEMIQLEKCVLISHLKQIVNKENIDLKKLFIIKGSDILELNKTIEECNLVDNDLLKVIKRDRRTIDVETVFSARISYEKFTLQIDIVEKVKDIKDRIMAELNSVHLESTDNIFLFYKSNYLDDDMFYFEFDTGKPGGLTYCYLEEARFLLEDQELKLIGTGDHNEIYECLDWSKKEIILKKSNSDIKENKSLINELMMFNETKSHSGFVQMLGVFRDETSFYVAMEKMSDNSISDFIKKKIPISDSLIIKWSQQILDGLEFLHSRKIVHRNIKPSNILLNENGNKVKISSFGLSKRLYGPKGIMEELLFSKVEILRYMAPEMYLTKFYNFKSDVYSFGATLTEIVTGKVPYEGQLIGNNFLEQIKYIYLHGLTFSSKNERLNNFVNQCIKPSHKERPFVSELRFDKFLK